MCGIAGAVGALDPSVTTLVGNMSGAELHRGPDDSGSYESGGSQGAVFGFRRLAIIDLSAEGHQPMLDDRQGNAIVFNGEIYNYAELRRELEAEGIAFRSQCDTEVLLKGYARFGRAILPRLRGMFAFALYDPARREVLLARDRLGIKPLYYALVERPSGRLLLFASELRALLASELFARELDPAAVASYLWNGFVVGPTTALRGISLLPPGALLSVPVDAPVARPERYWSLAAPQARPRDQAIAELGEALTTAARQHLVSDVPLGVFLSGGVDSSAVTALAVKAGSGRVRTFHVGFEERGFDESAYARRVADSLGTEHSELRLTQHRFRAELDQALSSLDQPTFDAINTYFVSRLVREAGFTVALAGTGGDELFGGYRSFRDLPRAARALKGAELLPQPLMARAAELAQHVKFGRSGEVPPQTRWGKLGDMLTAQNGMLGLYQVAYGLFTRRFLEQLVAPSLLGLAPHGLPPERRDELDSMVSRSTPLSAVSLLELSLFIGERLLRDTDAASMAVSLEVRVPLLDHRVVEAALGVPDQARVAPLGRKELLKSLAMPELDRAIFDRPKAGFVLPIEPWARDQLAPQIEAVFADRGLVESVGLRPEALGRLWRAFRAGAPGIYWSRVWAPFVLLDWCRRHRVGLA